MKPCVFNGNFSNRFKHSSLNPSNHFSRPKFDVSAVNDRISGLRRTILGKNKKLNNLVKIEQAVDRKSIAEILLKYSSSAKATSAHTPKHRQPPQYRKSPKKLGKLKDIGQTSPYIFTELSEYHIFPKKSGKLVCPKESTVISSYEREKQRVQTAQQGKEVFIPFSMHPKTYNVDRLYQSPRRQLLGSPTLTTKYNDIFTVHT